MSDPNNYGSSDIDQLLDARGRTHGDFVDHARITNKLKYVLSDEVLARDKRGQPRPSDAALESLSMICHKIGRIIAGTWDTADHWDDIAGYARLVSRSLEPVALPPVVDKPTERRYVLDSVDRSILSAISWESPPQSDNPGEDPGDSDRY